MAATPEEFIVQYKYVPILRLKRGERTGLAQLSPQGRADVVPLFVLDPAQYRPRGGRNPLSAAQLLVHEVSQCWGAAPFFLDATQLPIAPGAAHHPIVDIAAAARAAGLHLVPATRPTAWGSYQTGVASVVAIDGRGVGMRVDLQQLSTAAGWSSLMPFTPSNTDLIADFSSDIGTVAGLGSSLDHAFLNLHSGAAWRTVTVAGTSMPDNFTGVTAGTFAIARREYALWQHLTTLPLPYRLDYGDYATVPVNAPPPGIRWGFPINVKYTRVADFLVCRGVGTTGFGGVDMDVQLLAHARTIVADPTRARLAHCWADDQIDVIAAGTEGPGNLESWVRLSVSRHVERVRASLP